MNWSNSNLHSAFESLGCCQSKICPGGHAAEEGHANHQLSTKRDTKGEQGCARRAGARADDFWHFTHLLPDFKSRSIHVKQAHLLAGLSAEAVDAECLQEARLPRFDQVRPHADSRCVLNALHVFGALGNDLVDQRSRGVLREEVS